MQEGVCVARNEGTPQGGPLSPLLANLLQHEQCTEHDLRQVWTVEMMAPGNHLIFAATGISDSPMLPRIQYRNQHCVTHSVLMRARNRTVRCIQAFHDLARKTIRMHSTGQEMPL
jgi:fructose-1,6-bisphosphatase/sedoheptulose 1,7-bisphosphatase-like protein